MLNRPECNIITVEDPVEYRLDGITQVQVKPAIGMSFASVLKSILRQDPDIVLIGEIRDLETAEIAVSAALTGHLVLSTLHTNDAAGAVSRLINLGVPPFLVASSLLGTVAQRLVRKVCPKCRKPYSLTAEELELIGSSKSEIYQSSGCDRCCHSGYHGRTAIYEILGVSKQIRKMIIEGADTDSIKQRAIEEGMKTLRSSGIEQVLSGETTLEELMRIVDMGEN
jgi:type II secretory ATPase GspE/PulE/Tfp pilus assembly ATPase PilB-like protein